MKVTLKRTLLIALFALMIASISLCGVIGAFAADGVTEVSNYDSLVEALANEEDENVIALTADIVAPDAATLTISGKTLDLGGHTLTLNGESGSMTDSTIRNGTVEITTYTGDTVADGMFDTYGANTVANVLFHSTKSAIYAIFDIKTGTLEMNSCVIDMSNNDALGGLLYFNGGDKLTMTNCVVDATDVGDFITNGVVELNNCSVTLKGTTEGALDNGINGAALTLNNTELNVDGATGRGITTDGDDIVINGTSSVTLTDCDEGGVRYKAPATITVQNTASLVGTVKVDSAAVTDTTVAQIVTVDEDNVPVGEPTTLAATGDVLPYVAAENGAITTVATPPSGTITPAYTKPERITGDATATAANDGDDATEDVVSSFVVQLYEGSTLIATTTLTDTTLFAESMEITWSFKFDNSSSSWNVDWAEGYPNALMQPTKVVLLVDDVAVASNVFLFTTPDNLYPVVAGAESADGTFKGYYNSLEDAAAAVEKGDHVCLVADTNEEFLFPNGVTVTVANGVTAPNVANYIASITVEDTTTYYKTLAEAFAASNGNTVVLAGDITDPTLLAKDGAIGTMYSGNSQGYILVESDKTVVLDLNGYKIAVADPVISGNFAIIVNAGTLTINDSSAEQTGAIIVTSMINTSGYRTVLDNRGGTLTINGGTIEHQGAANKYPNAIRHWANTSFHEAYLTINGGTFKSADIAIWLVADSASADRSGTIYFTMNGGSVHGDYMGIWLQASNNETDTAGIISITGGSISTDSENGVAAYYSDYKNRSNPSLSTTISGGTFNGAVKARDGQITITDGTFNGEVLIMDTAQNVVESSDAISGGTFNAGVNTNYLASTADTLLVVCVTAADGSATVYSFETMEAALAALESVDASATVNVAFCKALDVTDSIVLNRDMTVDGNGYTISSDAAATITVNANVVLSNINITNTAENGAAIALGTGATLHAEPTTVLTASAPFSGYTVGQMITTTDADFAAALNAAGYALTSATVDEVTTYTVVTNAPKATLNGWHYDTFANALAAANGGDTIILLDYLTVDQSIVINADITINGNGYTITSNATSSVFTLNASLALDNVTIINNVDSAPAFMLGADVDLTVSGNCAVNSAIVLGGYDSVAHTHKVTVGSVALSTALEAEGYYMHNNGDGTYTISEHAVAKIGNTLYETFAEALENAQPGDTIIILQNIELDATVVIDKNLTFTGNFTLLSSSADVMFELADGVSLTINCEVRSTAENGVILGSWNGQTVKTNNEAVRDLLNAEGYAMVEEATGVWTVKAAKAAIGTKNYASLTDALAAVQNGETIVLLDNAELTSTVILDKTVTIDGSAYKIVSSASTAFLVSGNLTLNTALECTYANGVAFTLSNGATVAINGAVTAPKALAGWNAQTTVTTTVESVRQLINGEGYALVSETAGVWTVATDKPEVAINGLNYVSLADAIAAADAGDTITLLQNITVAAPIAITKELTINGGKSLTASGTVFDVSAKLTLANVTLNADTAFGLGEGAELMLADGCVLNVTAILADYDKAAHTVKTTDPAIAGQFNTAGYALTFVTEEEVTTYTVVTDSPEASADGWNYATLEDAISNAISAVTLLKDIERSATITIDKAITINGAGKTVSSTAAPAFTVAANLTLNNITISATGSSAKALEITGASVTLTASDANITANGSAIYRANATATLNITLTRVALSSDSDYALYVGEIANTSNIAATITMTDCTVGTVSAPSAKGVSISAASGSTLTVNGGYYYATTQAMYFAGNLSVEVNGATLSASTEQTVYIKNAVNAVLNNTAVSYTGAAGSQSAIYFANGWSPSLRITGNSTVTATENFAIYLNSGASNTPTLTIDGNTVLYSAGGTNGAYKAVLYLNNCKPTVSIGGNAKLLTTNSGAQTIRVTGGNVVLNLRDNAKVGVADTSAVADAKVANRGVSVHNANTVIHIYISDNAEFGGSTPIYLTQDASPDCTVNVSESCTRKVLIENRAVPGTAVCYTRAYFLCSDLRAAISHYNTSWKESVITLYGDLTIASGQYADLGNNKIITIDGRGHTLTGDFVHIKMTGGTATIKNLTMRSGSSVLTTGATSHYGVLMLDNSLNITLDNVDIYASGTNSSDHAIYFGSAGTSTVIIRDSYISANAGRAIHRSNASGGCTITAEFTNTTFISQSNLYVLCISDTATTSFPVVTMTNCIVTGYGASSFAVAIGGFDVNTTDANFSQYVTQSKLTIIGGTYTGVKGALRLNGDLDVTVTGATLNSSLKADAAYTVYLVGSVGDGVNATFTDVIVTHNNTDETNTDAAQGSCFYLANDSKVMLRIAGTSMLSSMYNGIEAGTATASIVLDGNISISAAGPYGIYFHSATNKVDLTLKGNVTFADNASDDVRYVSAAKGSVSINAYTGHAAVLYVTLSDGIRIWNMYDSVATAAAYTNDQLAKREISLYKDVTETATINVTGVALTIYGNGHTIKGAQKVIYVDRTALTLENITVEGSSTTATIHGKYWAELTIKNSTIIATNAGADAHAVWYDDGVKNAESISRLTITNSTIDANGGRAVHRSNAGNGGMLIANLTSSTFTANNNWAVVCFSDGGSLYYSLVNMTDCKVIAKSTTVQYPVGVGSKTYDPEHPFGYKHGFLTMLNCSIKGGAGGIIARGDVDITLIDCEITIDSNVNGDYRAIFMTNASDTVATDITLRLQGTKITANNDYSGKNVGGIYSDDTAFATELAGSVTIFISDDCVITTDGNVFQENGDGIANISISVSDSKLESTADCIFYCASNPGDLTFTAHNTEMIAAKQGISTSKNGKVTITLTGTTSIDGNNQAIYVSAAGAASVTVKDDVELTGGSLESHVFQINGGSNATVTISGNASIISEATGASSNVTAIYINAANTVARITISGNVTITGPASRSDIYFTSDVGKLTDENGDPLSWIKFENYTGSKIIAYEFNTFSTKNWIFGDSLAEVLSRYNSQMGDSIDRTITLLKDLTENETVTGTINDKYAATTIYGNGYDVAWVLTNAEDAAIAIADGNLTISDLTINSNGRGIVMTASGTHVMTLTNVHITTVGTTIDGDDDGTNPSLDLYATNSSFESTASHCISIDTKASSVYLTDSRVSASAASGSWYGINLCLSDTSKVSKLSIVATEAYTTRVDDTDGKLIPDVYSVYRAIALRGNSSVELTLTNVHIASKNNAIHRSSGNGNNFKTLSGSITNCRLYSEAGNALYLTNNALIKPASGDWAILRFDLDIINSELESKNSTIIACARLTDYGDGLRSQLDITNCTIKSTDEHALFARGDVTVNATGSEFRSTGTHTIHAQYESDVTLNLTNCLVDYSGTDNTQAAIYTVAIGTTTLNLLMDEQGLGSTLPNGTLQKGVTITSTGYGILAENENSSNVATLNVTMHDSSITSANIAVYLISEAYVTFSLNAYDSTIESTGSGIRGIYIHSRAAYHLYLEDTTIKADSYAISCNDNYVGDADGDGEADVNTITIKMTELKVDTTPDIWSVNAHAFYFQWDALVTLELENVYVYGYDYVIRRSNSSTDDARNIFTATLTNCRIETDASWALLLCTDATTSKIVLHVDIIDCVIDAKMGIGASGWINDETDEKYVSYINIEGGRIDVEGQGNNGNAGYDALWIRGETTLNLKDVTVTSQKGNVLSISSPDQYITVNMDNTHFITHGVDSYIVLSSNSDVHITAINNCTFTATGNGTDAFWWSGGAHRKSFNMTGGSITVLSGAAVDGEGSPVDPDFVYDAYTASKIFLLSAGVQHSITLNGVTLSGGYGIYVNDADTLVLNITNSSFDTVYYGIYAQRNKTIQISGTVTDTIFDAELAYAIAIGFNPITKSDDVVSGLNSGDNAGSVTVTSLYFKGCTVTGRSGIAVNTKADSNSKVFIQNSDNHTTSITVTSDALFTGGDVYLTVNGGNYRATSSRCLYGKGSSTLDLIDITAIGEGCNGMYLANNAMVTVILRGNSVLESTTHVGIQICYSSSGTSVTLSDNAQILAYTRGILYQGSVDRTYTITVEDNAKIIVDPENNYGYGIAIYGEDYYNYSSKDRVNRATAIINIRDNAYLEALRVIAFGDHGTQGQIKFDDYGNGSNALDEADQYDPVFSGYAEVNINGNPTLVGYHIITLRSYNNQTGNGYMTVNINGGTYIINRSISTDDVGAFIRIAATATNISVLNISNATVTYDAEGCEYAAYGIRIQNKTSANVAIRDSYFNLSGPSLYVYWGSVCRLDSIVIENSILESSGSHVILLASDDTNAKQMSIINSQIVLRGGAGTNAVRIATNVDVYVEGSTFFANGGEEAIFRFSDADTIYSIVMRNSTIIGDAARAFWASNGLFDLEFENVKIINVGGHGIELSSGGDNTLHHAVLRNVDVESYGYCVWDKGNAGCTLDIIGGSYITTNLDAAIYAQATGIANIYSGYFEGHNLCCVRTTGDAVLNIYGGYFNYIGDGTGTSSAIGSPVRVGTAAEGAGNYINIYGGTYVTDVDRAIFTLYKGTALNLFAFTCRGGNSIYADNNGDTIQWAYPEGTNFYACNAPELNSGAQIRLSLTDERAGGIRFVTTISAEALARFENFVAAGLGENLSFGTIIVPADYLEGLNAFTVSELNRAGKQYLDIVAENGITYNADGSMTLRAVLANVREENYDRAFAAVAYIKYTVNGEDVYVYSNFDAQNNVRSLKQLTERALSDLRDYQSSSHRFATGDGKYSPYTDAQRAALMVINNCVLTEEIITPATTFEPGLKRVTCEACGTSYEEVIPATNSLKVLVIGNSLDEASMEAMWLLLDTFGLDEIIVASAYIDGCTVEEHFTNMTEGNAVYTYYKNVYGYALPATEGLTMGEILTDKAWDLILVTETEVEGDEGDELAKAEALQGVLEMLTESNPNTMILDLITEVEEPESNNNDSNSVAA